MTNKRNLRRLPALLQALAGRLARQGREHAVPSISMSARGCAVYVQLENVSPECRLWSCMWLVDPDPEAAESSFGRIAAAT